MAPASAVLYTQPLTFDPPKYSFFFRSPSFAVRSATFVLPREFKTGKTFLFSAFHDRLADLHLVGPLIFAAPIYG